VSAVTGIDLGTRAVKVADGGGVQTLAAPPGGPAGALRAALSAVGGRGVICIAVPDAWLSGAADGAAVQEAFRHECAEDLKYAQVLWAGQLAAAAAWTSAAHGAGRYLVCDIGVTGTRAGMFSVAAGAVRVEATHAEAAGGWRAFDTELRAGLPQSPPLPAAWYEQAADYNQARAAAALDVALGRTAGDRTAEVYRIIGPDGDVVLTAGRLIEGFEPAKEALEAAIMAVRGRIPPDYIVLTGGLGWLPLAARAAGTAAGAAALVAGPDAAARGALLLAYGDAVLVPPAERGPVAVPFSRVRDGLLEEVDGLLPWTEPFAEFPGGPLMLDGEELAVLVAGHAKVARLRGLLPGLHLIGARPAWPGPGVLVVRSATGGGPVHVVPLAELTAG
jgi:hypothetical protein